MHFSWLSEKPPTPEATWADHSYYFRPYYYKVTVSERDHIERTNVYFNETIIPENQGLNGSDFLPLNFKSSFSIVTHQGKSHDPKQHYIRNYQQRLSFNYFGVVKAQKFFCIWIWQFARQSWRSRCRQWSHNSVAAGWLNPQKCGSFVLMAKITPGCQLPPIKGGATSHKDHEPNVESM